MDESLKGDHDEDFFLVPMVLSIYYAAQCSGSNFQCVDEILKGDHPNESY